MRRRETPAYAVPPIDGFGAGGFRVAGARREGHVLIMDGTTKAWPVDGDPRTLTASDFSAFLARADTPDMVVLGLGRTLVHPPAEVRQAFREAGVGLEALDTATACRTYNLLAGEARRVCAALIAV